MPEFFVPPGGFSGFSQMTPASRAALSPGRSAAPRRRAKKKRASTRKLRGKRRSTGRKIKFGSPAWRKKYNLGKKKR